MSSNDKYERILEEYQLSELTDADTFFKRLSGIDPKDVPANYGNYVSDGQKMLMDHCTIRTVYQRLKIASKNDASTTVVNNSDAEFVLKGEMVSQALGDSDELYAFVLTIDGYENIPTNDIMLEYMMDTWGSAYTECAQADLATRIGAIATTEDKIRTHVWCPGQFKFDLKNQSELFSILNPADIHCRLTERLMMVPVKSASGIIGLLPKDSPEPIKPCDYCQHKSSCPASNKGCAAL